MGSSQSTTHDIPPQIYDDIIVARKTERTTTQCTVPHINEDSTTCFQCNGMPQNGYQSKRRGLCDSTKETGSLIRNKKLLNNCEDTIGTNLKKIIKPPNRFNNLDDFIQNWSIWQDQFTSFLTLNDSNKLKYHEWGYFFLHFMGPIGQEILNNLFFDKQDDKKDYVILMRKYNSFHEFYTTAKFENESIMDYINRLKSEAALNIINVDEALKEKLAKDIQKHHRERNCFSVAALRRIYFSKQQKLYILWPIPYKRTMSCLCFCGGNHIYKKCPAYGETCSKCGNMNHFSWKCSKKILLKNCHFCGLSHLQDRNKCPARNSLCCICKTRGHYEVKCCENQNATK
ncbi:hypothetical protein KPH14_004106 [Odynerus spinipes]|uniref:CCHC-type domain-containing protein n=1 Tax=Odynerus spinipes TaxID=1348599 RepID=A0AAD9VW12_9HYME|nr:hypothetical protein KPH14_004106 [Odynerus spinipes]